PSPTRRASDLADFHHRELAGKSQDHCHLQQYAKRVANIVGMEFGETFRTIAALQQECPARSHFRQPIFQSPRFPGEHQWRKLRNHFLRCGKSSSVGIFGQVPCLKIAPAVRSPILSHVTNFQNFRERHYLSLPGTLCKGCSGYLPPCPPSGTTERRQALSARRYFRANSCTRSGVISV